jgi:hypothetical protein
MNHGLNACVSLRKTYTAILGALTAWSFMAGIIAGAPVLYFIGFLVYHSVNPSYISALLSTSGYSVFGVLLFAWLIAILAICKNIPALLTFTIFIYNCLGHWSLVSFVILIFYGFSNLPGSYILYLSSILIPSILLLLFSSDLMLEKRSSMFRELERPILPIVTSASSAPVLAPKPDENV